MDDKMYDRSREAHAEIKKDIAEADREAAMNVAAATAADRDAALDAAAHEAVRRDVAESQAVDSRIYANQANQAAREMATERNILRHDLEHERAAASNNAFGFYLALALLMGVLIFGGYWLYNRYADRDDVVVAAPAPAAPSTTTIVAPGPAPAPSPSAVVPAPVPVPVPTPSAQDERPINVTVPPPQVRVNITPPAPAPAPENPGTTGETSGGGESGSVTP